MRQTAQEPGVMVVKYVRGVMRGLYQEHYCLIVWIPNHGPLASEANNRATTRPQMLTSAGYSTS